MQLFCAEFHLRPRAHARTRPPIDGETARVHAVFELLQRRAFREFQHDLGDAMRYAEESSTQRNQFLNLGRRSRTYRTVGSKLNL